MFEFKHITFHIPHPTMSSPFRPPTPLYPRITDGEETTEYACDIRRARVETWGITPEHELYEIIAWASICPGVVPLPPFHFSITSTSSDTIQILVPRRILDTQALMFRMYGLRTTDEPDDTFAEHIASGSCLLKDYFASPCVQIELNAVSVSTSKHVCTLRMDRARGLNSTKVKALKSGVPTILGVSDVRRQMVSRGIASPLDYIYSPRFVAWEFGGLIPVELLLLHTNTSRVDPHSPVPYWIRAIEYGIELEGTNSAVYTRSPETQMDVLIHAICHFARATRYTMDWTYAPSRAHSAGSSTRYDFDRYSVLRDTPDLSTASGDCEDRSREISMAFHDLIKVQTDEPLIVAAQRAARDYMILLVDWVCSPPPETPAKSTMTTRENIVGKLEAVIESKTHSYHCAPILVPTERFDRWVSDRATSTPGTCKLPTLFIDSNVPTTQADVCASADQPDYHMTNLGVETVCDRLALGAGGRLRSIIGRSEALTPARHIVDTRYLCATAVYSSARWDRGEAGRYDIGYNWDTYGVAPRDLCRDDIVAVPYNFTKESPSAIVVRQFLPISTPINQMTNMPHLVFTWDKVHRPPAPHEQCVVFMVPLRTTNPTDTRLQEICDDLDSAIDKHKVRDFDGANFTVEVIGAIVGFVTERLVMIAVRCQMVADR